MICTVIKGPTFQAALEQIETSQQQSADYVELRLDLFEQWDVESLKKLRATCFIPMIFTLRDQTQGGAYRYSEKNRLARLQQLAALHPDYIDLEAHVPASFIEELGQAYPKIKLIISYHNFDTTPLDLDHIYKQMQRPQAAFYKIAVAANESTDALRLLCWKKQQAHHKNLIVIGMNTHGQPTRILAPIMESPWTYAPLNDIQQTAPGQINISTLKELYHYSSLHPKTEIYGLIGNPVEQSIGHLTHNHLMLQMELDAVYLKMPVNPEELPHFLKLARQLPFRGLSVTMPLKENILPWLDEVDPKAAAIGSVNTLVFKQGKIIGYNTDASGALDAIEMETKAKGQKIVIIGAGGAARAIAYEAIQRGGLVTILNRTVERACRLANDFKCSYGSLDEMDHYATNGYDILINSTPNPLPIDPSHLRSDALIMDIKNRPKETILLQHARQKGCRITYGYKMFVEQAIGQFNLWFNNKIDPDAARAILTKVSTIQL